MLGIIAAGKIEVRAILDNSFFQWTEIKKKVFYSPKNIYLVISGIGKKNAAIGLRKIIDKVQEVLILGTSGGLKQTKLHDIFLIGSLPRLKGNFKTGKLITVDRVGEKGDGDLVDMESEIIFKLCQAKNIPVAALRYITDLCDANTTQDWKKNVPLASRSFNEILGNLC